MNNIQSKLQIHILISNIYQHVISNKFSSIYRFLLSYGRSGLCGITIKNAVQKNRNFNLVTKTDVNMHLFYEQLDCIYILQFTEVINIHVNVTWKKKLIRKSNYIIHVIRCDLLSWNLLTWNWRENLLKYFNIKPSDMKFTVRKIPWTSHDHGYNYVCLM